MGLSLFEVIAVFTGASSMTQAENRSKRSLALLEEQTAMQRERHRREAVVWREEDHRREMEALRLRQEREREKAQRAAEFYLENTHGETFRVYENGVATVFHALVGRVLNARAFDDGRRRGYAIREGDDLQAVRVISEAEFRQRYRRWVEKDDEGSNELPPAPWTNNPRWVSPRAAANAPQPGPALPQRTAAHEWDAALVQGRAAGPTIAVRPRLGVRTAEFSEETGFEATPVRSEGHRSYVVRGLKSGTYVEVSPSEYARDWIENVTALTTASVPRAIPKRRPLSAATTRPDPSGDRGEAVSKPRQGRKAAKARTNRPPAVAPPAEAPPAEAPPAAPPVVALAPPVVAAAPPLVAPAGSVRAILQQDAGEALDGLRRWRLRQTERVVERLVGRSVHGTSPAEPIDGTYHANTPSGAATLTISEGCATVVWPDGSGIRDARVERQAHWVRLLGGAMCEGGTVRASLSDDALQVGTLDPQGAITLHGESSALRFVRGSKGPT